MKKASTSPVKDGFDLPVDTFPMEATSAVRLPTGGEWQYEPKWDGFRCLAFKADDRVDLRAKSGKPLGRFFPEVVESIRGLDGNFVIDGELVIEVNGRLSFDDLQMRLHPAESRVRKLSQDTPGHLIVFDMLSEEGRSLLALPLRQRRERLEAFVRKRGRASEIVISPYTRDIRIANKWLAEGGANGTDGVVAKRIDGAYEAGSRAMLKIKLMRTADCVVGGFRYESDGKAVGSLLLGLYNDKGELDHVGYTSGIAAHERVALTHRLEKLRQAPGFTGKRPGAPSRWSVDRSSQWEPLKPELVVEIRYDHVTGNRLRHGAKIVRWRPDKDPRQCTLHQIENAGGPRQD